MRGVRMAVRPWARRVLLCLPMIFVAVFLVVPLGLTMMISFWERAGVKFRPALSLASYVSLVGGARLDVLQRSLVVAIEATALSLVIAYLIAYFLARKVAPATARIVLVLFTVPFLINYIVRDVSPGPAFSAAPASINSALLAAGLIDAPLDWLLYSDFAVLLGLISSYMPFMIFPLFLSIGAIDRQYLEASALLGASPFTHLPHHHPAAVAAGRVRRRPVRLRRLPRRKRRADHLGGVGYELIGNTITSSMDVLNYPLAAALSIGRHRADAAHDPRLVSRLRYAELPRPHPRMESVMENHAARWRSWPLWLIIALALAFLYVPLIPSLVASLQGVRPGEWTLGWYGELWRTPLIVGAFRAIGNGRA